VLRQVRAQISIARLPITFNGEPAMTICPVRLAVETAAVMQNPPK
jgi:hypothetical protein